MTDATLIIPGVLFIGAESSDKDTAVVQLGTAVGWTIPRGVSTWSRELTVVMKQDVTPELRKELGVLLPEDQGDADVVPRARRAAQACKLVAIERALTEKLVAKGVRVHTVGFDRVSNGFFYFASGGAGGQKRVQGELIEIIAPSLVGGSSREDLDARLDGLIDRLLAELSEGAISEAQLELAEALPVLAPKGAEEGDKLQTLEGWLILASTRAAKFEAEAKKLAEALRGATLRDGDVVPVPLFSEARRVEQPELEVEVIEGDAGNRSRLTLPARTRWFVTGAPSSSRAPGAAPAVAARPEAAQRAPAAARPVSAPAPAQNSAGEAARLAAERQAAEKAAADRAAAARSAAEAQRAAAEKAAAERAAAERAASEKAAAERAAADRAAAERAASERAAAERAAAERAAAERAQAERAALEGAQAEKSAADSRRAAEERASAEQAAARRVAAESVAVERKAAERRSPETRPRKKEPLSFGFFLLMLILGAAIGAALTKVINH
jgi:hypothetical protein